MKVLMGTIVSGVIIGLVVWELTKPPGTTTIEGVVYNKQVENARIANAWVMFEIWEEGHKINGPYRHPTDSNGVYQIDFSGLPSSANVVISVSVTGFQNPPAITLTSLSDVIHQDIGLTPVAPTGSPMIGRPNAVFVRPPPFIAKESSLVTHIVLPTKK